MEVTKWLKPSIHAWVGSRKDRFQSLKSISKDRSKNVSATQKALG
jgi:hypothetical protein